MYVITLLQPQNIVLADVLTVCGGKYLARACCAANALRPATMLAYALVASSGPLMASELNKSLNLSRLMIKQFF